MTLSNKLRFKNTGVTQNILKVRHPKNLSRIILTTDKCSGYDKLEIIFDKHPYGYSGMVKTHRDDSKFARLEKIELIENNGVVTIKCEWVDYGIHKESTECNMSFELNVR